MLYVNNRLTRITHHILELHEFTEFITNLIEDKEIPGDKVTLNYSGVKYEGIIKAANINESPDNIFPNYLEITIENIKCRFWFNIKSEAIVTINKVIINLGFISLMDLGSFVINIIKEGMEIFNSYFKDDIYCSYNEVVGSGFDFNKVEF